MEPSCGSVAGGVAWQVPQAAWPVPTLAQVGVVLVPPAPLEP